MIKAIFLLFPFLLLNKAQAQQNIVAKGHKVTFKLKIAEIANPDSIAIVWFTEPYIDDKTVEQCNAFPPKKEADGLYQQTIVFPDSLMGKTVKHLFVAANNKHDFWRSFVPEPYRIVNI